MDVLPRASATSGVYGWTRRGDPIGGGNLDLQQGSPSKVAAPLNLDLDLLAGQAAGDEHDLSVSQSSNRISARGHGVDADRLDGRDRFDGRDRLSPTFDRSHGSARLGRHSASVAPSVERSVTAENLRARTLASEPSVTRPY